MYGQVICSNTTASTNPAVNKTNIIPVPNFIRINTKVVDNLENTKLLGTYYILSSCFYYITVY